ncbi:early nodulin-like protein 3 [Gastrolobium bilobum]|uniref:early nodulin-like protein 3 n=1 Tax=Gastrolobium bilobum TaxID=150636 RepID=UPI002AB1FE63|nr:early nodulin-like protein 3 [Gastrolobium bilobum]
MVGFGNIIPNKFLGLLLLMILMFLLSSSSSSQVAAKEFSIGGKDGWVVKPSEYYNQWAQENKFQVNDILYFKYKKGDDLVLVGHFFFISGNVDNCKNGQKLIIFAIAVRETLSQATPPSRSPASVSYRHGGGDGGGWSGGVNDDNRCTQPCCTLTFCTCC